MQKLPSNLTEAQEMDYVNNILAKNIRTKINDFNNSSVDNAVSIIKKLFKKLTQMNYHFIVVTKNVIYCILKQIMDGLKKQSKMLKNLINYY